jgi:hypothetical protein
VGTTAREVSRFLGRRIEVDSTITEFRPGRRLAYRTSSGPFPFDGAFDVVPKPRARWPEFSRQDASFRGQEVGPGLGATELAPKAIESLRI